MKFINVLFVLVFSASALVQYNDPDPLIWMGIYGYGALLCFMAILGKDKRVWHYFGLVVYLSYALYLFVAPHGVLSWIADHGVSDITGTMSAEKPWIEFAREFFGLLILSFALSLNLFCRKKEFTS